MWWYKCDCTENNYLYFAITIYPIITCYLIWNQERKEKYLKRQIKILIEKNDELEEALKEKKD